MATVQVAGVEFDAAAAGGGAFVQVAGIEFDVAGGTGTTVQVAGVEFDVALPPVAPDGLYVWAGAWHLGRAFVWIEDSTLPDTLPETL